MSLPISLHGNEYIEHLRTFRDRALVESYQSGRRRRLGNISLGRVTANWHYRDNEGALSKSVLLFDSGLRHGDKSLSNVMPTKMVIISDVGEDDAAFEIRTYKMELSVVGCIKTYLNMVTEYTWLELAKAEMHNLLERDGDLHDPTDEQREQLYFEMLMGATGVYRSARD